MQKSLITHYKNKYPNGMIQASETSLDVYGEDGTHRVSMQKNGSGQFVDVSSQVGAADCHDLAPIPKDTRVFKLYSDGSIRPSEEADERRVISKEITGIYKGKIPSISDIFKDYSIKGSYDSDWEWAKNKPSKPKP